MDTLQLYLAMKESQAVLEECENLYRNLTFNREQISEPQSLKQLYTLNEYLQTKISKVTHLAAQLLPEVED